MNTQKRKNYNLIPFERFKVHRTVYTSKLSAAGRLIEEEDILLRAMRASLTAVHASGRHAKMSPEQLLTLRSAIIQRLGADYELDNFARRLLNHVGPAVLEDYPLDDPEADVAQQALTEAVHHVASAHGY